MGSGVKLLVRDSFHPLLLQDFGQVTSTVFLAVELEKILSLDLVIVDLK